MKPTSERTGENRNPDAPIDAGRRRFVQTTGLVTLAAAAGLWRNRSRAADKRPDAPRVVVVGAGAFGGWTAWHLLGQGADVTLVDAFGAGHSRSSSGGETRVIRGMYGGDELYLDWVVRSFDWWARAEQAWSQPLYTRTSALWMFRGDDDYARNSLPLMAQRGLPAEELSLSAAQSRYPRIDFNGVGSVFVEHRAGFLAARRACRLLAEDFVRNGGQYRRAQARPGTIRDGRMHDVVLGDGERLEADAFVFACGPWMPQLFAETLAQHLQPTRQEVYYFGTPAGDRGFDPAHLPVWVDFGERLFYGIPGNDGRGFKVADDTRGEPAEPTGMSRTPTPEGIARCRQFIAERFPALANAPLVEARVCQYTNSPDGNLLIDRHPGTGNLWLAGAGSGHGFKFAPALGEYLSGVVLGQREALTRFGLARLG